jgi:O-antigen/teichoic acid export membrane protein
MMEGLIVLAGVIMMVGFPRLSRFGHDNRKAFKTFFSRLLIILLLLAISVGVVMYVCAAPVFHVVLGEQYVESIGIFKILLVAVVFIYPGTLVTQSLIALDRQKIYMYTGLVCAVLNILLNLILIPEYGTKGAAWATVVTESVMTIVCGGFVYHYSLK